jgi:hypothetical protein
MRENPTNTPIIHSVYWLCMVTSTCFGISLPSSGSIPSAFWEMLNWGAVDKHHITRHNAPIHNILSTAPQLNISQKALWTLPDDGNAMPKYVGATIHNYEWIIGVFVSFLHIFLLEILIFKGLTVLCLYKSFGVKELIL